MLGGFEFSPIFNNNSVHRFNLLAGADINGRGHRAGWGHALPIALDIRFEDAVKAAVQQAVQRFGGIDILVNNASAISLTSTAQTSIKRLDLMLGSGLSRVYGEVGIFTEG